MHLQTVTCSTEKDDQWEHPVAEYKVKPMKIHLTFLIIILAADWNW